MLSIFEEARNERHYQGWAWYFRFMFAEFNGLIAGAAEAWLAPKQAAETRIASFSYLPQELMEAQQRVDANIAAMVHAIAHHQFERARVLSNQEREARKHLRALRDKYGTEDQFA